ALGQLVSRAPAAALTELDPLGVLQGGDDLAEAVHDVSGDIVEKLPLQGGHGLWGAGSRPRSPGTARGRGADANPGPAQPYCLGNDRRPLEAGPLATARHVISPGTRVECQSTACPDWRGGWS
ncbi:hypothetical protein NDU88_000520, partial [Pleurodeles waltl]